MMMIHGDVHGNPKELYILKNNSPKNSCLCVLSLCCYLAIRMLGPLETLHFCRCHPKKTVIVASIFRYLLFEILLFNGCLCTLLWKS
jgi:hypothetical protein